MNRAVPLSLLDPINPLDDLPQPKALRRDAKNAKLATMFNAYVGIVSREGLNLLHLERADTVLRIRRSAAAGDGIVFWAVVPEEKANVIRLLLCEGEQDSALHYLDQSARDFGRLTPTR